MMEQCKHHSGHERTVVGGGIAVGDTSKAGGGGNGAAREGCGGCGVGGGGGVALDPSLRLSERVECHVACRIALRRLCPHTREARSSKWGGAGCNVRGMTRGNATVAVRWNGTWGAMRMREHTSRRGSGAVSAGGVLMRAALG